jgi:hypothetical protein
MSNGGSPRVDRFTKNNPTMTRATLHRLGVVECRDCMGNHYDTHLQNRRSQAKSGPASKHHAIPADFLVFGKNRLAAVVEQVGEGKSSLL